MSGAEDENNTFTIMGLNAVIEKKREIRKINKITLLRRTRYTDLSYDFTPTTLYYIRRSSKFQWNFSLSHFS